MIYKKEKKFFSQQIELLRQYYHASSYKQLFHSLVEDFIVSLVLGAGSGIFMGFIRGIVGLGLIKSKIPLFIGKRFKVIHPHFLRLGHHVWIRDDVTIYAYGKMSIGDNTVIGEGTTLYSDREGLMIGKGVGFGKNCYVAQAGGRIEIGNNVLIADNVHFYSLNHKYNNPKKLIIEQGYELSTITVKDNVWIGSGVAIFNNVTIGTGSVVGANSVITKDVPSYCVVAGVPGRVIKKIK